MSAHQKGARESPFTAGAGPEKDARVQLGPELVSLTSLSAELDFLCSGLLQGQRSLGV